MIRRLIGEMMVIAHNLKDEMFRWNQREGVKDHLQDNSRPVSSPLPVKSESGRSRAQITTAVWEFVR